MWLLGLIAMSAGADEIWDADRFVTEGYKRYGVESGMVSIAHKGAGSGTTTIWFDHWGWREAKLVNKSSIAMGNPVEQHTWELLDGEVLTTVDLMDRKGVRDREPELLAKAQSIPSKSMVHVGRDLLVGMGGVEGKPMKVAKLQCVPWTVESLTATICLHETGLTLHSQSAFMGIELVDVATRVDLNATVDPARFSVPAGMTVLEKLPQPDLK